MAEAATISQAEPVVQQQDDPTKNRLGWNLWALWLPLLGLAPLLIYRLTFLLRSDSLRPTLLTFALAGWILFSRGRKNGERLLINRVWLSVGLLVAAALIYLYAVWVFSPYLAYFCLLLVLCAWSIQQYENQHWAATCTWVVVIMVTLGLPGSWGDWLQSSLISSACGLTSLSLDAFHVPNILLGTNIELVGMLVPAEPLCRGAGNVFTLAAITLAILVLQHRTLLNGIVSLLFVPLWMVLAHYFKLMVIVVGHTYLVRDITSGLDFTLVNIFSFLFAVLLSWGFTIIVAWLSEPVIVTAREFGPIFEILNRGLRWPHRLPEMEPTDPEEKERYLSRLEERRQRLRAMPRVHWYENSRAKTGLMVSSLLILIAGLAPLAVLVQGSVVPRFRDVTLSDDAQARISQLQLPAQIGTAQVIPVETSATSENPQRVWNIVKGQLGMQLTVTSGFLGWHDPTEQLVNRGWSIGGKGRFQQSASSKWGIFAASVQTDLGAVVYLFSSMTDDEMKIVDLVPNFQGASVSRSRDNQRKTILDLLQGDVRNDDRLTTEILLQVNSGENLQGEEIDELIELYDQLRSELVK